MVEAHLLKSLDPNNRKLLEASESGDGVTFCQVTSDKSNLTL